jgi:hypothetical protein
MGVRFAATWHVFPVRIRHGRRGALRARLDAVGIGTNVHYPKPIHRMADRKVAIEFPHRAMLHRPQDTERLLHQILP